MKAGRPCWPDREDQPVSSWALCGARWGI